MPAGVGNWSCSCGQEYRYAAAGRRIAFWPRSGLHAYRPQPLDSPQCIRCGSGLPSRLHAIVAAAAPAQ